MKCPHCGKNLGTYGKDPSRNRYFPFCSQRCKLIDLGQWFDGDHKIISKADEQEDEEFSNEAGN